MKKLLLLVLASLTLLLLATACTGGEGAAETTAAPGTEAPTEAPVTEVPATEAPATEAPATEAPATEAPTEAPFDPLAFEPAALPVANVAREGFVLASASKSDGGFSNTYLNDGDYTTGFSTPWEVNQDAAKEYYFYVDLTASKTLDSIKLYPLAGEEAAFPRAFDVQVSEDGVSYTTVASVTDATAEAAREGLSVSLNNAEGRFVRVLTRELGEGEGRKGKYLSLSEFEVYAPIDTASNMILNRHDIWLFKEPDTVQQLEILYYRDGTPVDPAVPLRFATLDPAVATVDEQGLITPVGVGATSVYVTDGKNLAVCQVEVKVESRDEFRVSTFYHSNFAYPEQIPVGLKILADSGIEYVEDTRATDCVGNHISMYSLFLCDSLGMAYSPHDPVGGPNYRNLTDEEIIAVVQKYENRAGFYGVYLQDEPHEEYLEYAHIFHVIQEYNPHLIPHLNLLPPYNFGGVDEYFTEFAAMAGGNGRMRFLSYDHYPFLWGGGFNTQVYASLNRLRKAGLFYNADTGFYMQAMVITGAYREMSDTDLMYNATLGMAYGLKNYKWFVALTPVNSGEAFTTGLVAPDFTPSSMHAGVTAANAYIKTVGALLGNSDAVEVYHTNGEPDNQTLPSDFIFSHVSGGTAIYTLYTPIDGEGPQHVVITNKRFTAGDATTFRVRVNGDIGKLSYLDLASGEMKSLSVGADGTFKVDVGPGQCVVIRLPEGYDATRPAETSDNLALGRPVYVNSSQATFWEDGDVAAFRLTDGTADSGKWMGALREEYLELTLDLGQTATVKEMRFLLNAGIRSAFSLKNFTLYASEDGVNYTEVTTVTEAEYDENLSFTLALDSVSARYFRIVVTDGRGGGFAEWEVYG